MPIYRTPVFEDASGRAPGLQLRPDYVVKATLDPSAKVEDCAGFFRVTQQHPSRAAGWRPASPADLAAPVRVVAASGSPVVAPAAAATPKPVAAEPEGAEPAPKPKRSRSKKKDEA